MLTIHRRLYKKEWREVYENCIFEFYVENWILLGWIIKFLDRIVKISMKKEQYIWVFTIILINLKLNIDLK